MNLSAYAALKGALRVGLAGAALGATLIPLNASAATLPPLQIDPPPARFLVNPFLDWREQTLAENAGYWQPIMGTKFRQAGMQMTTAFPGSPRYDFDTACGKKDVRVGAMYCGEDQTIYVDIVFLERQNANFGKYTSQLILAHEYGHHIQRLQGLPDRGMMTELQADCPAGASLLSMGFAEKLDGPALAGAMVSASNAAGDPSAYNRDHGTGHERIAALIDGWSDLGHCNLTDPSGYYYPTFAAAGA
jgi:predicted metalloprotease